MTRSSSKNPVIAGRYELLDSLGEGGMGAVHRARHKFTGQLVALKLLKIAKGTSEEAQERFIREAHQQNQIDHPAVPRVLDAGMSTDTEAYLAMEMLEGRDLAELADGLPFKEFVRICIETLDALEAVHAAGIVHRDIKPGNIFLQDTDRGKPRVRLLDFGIATSHRHAKITAKGVAMGTVMYMSPEQARGEVVDRRADIWSVGGILFRAATGHTPYAETGRGPLMVAVATKAPRRVHDVAPHVPAHTARVIDRALSYRASDRFSSAAEMRDALALLTPTTLRGVTSPLTEPDGVPVPTMPTEPDGFAPATPKSIEVTVPSSFEQEVEVYLSGPQVIAKRVSIPTEPSVSRTSEPDTAPAKRQSAPRAVNAAPTSQPPPPIPARSSSPAVGSSYPPPVPTSAHSASRSEGARSSAPSNAPPRRRRRSIKETIQLVILDKKERRRRRYFVGGVLVAAAVLGLVVGGVLAASEHAEAPAAVVEPVNAQSPLPVPDAVSGSARRSRSSPMIQVTKTLTTPLTPAARANNAGAQPPGSSSADASMHTVASPPSVAQPPSAMTTRVVGRRTRASNSRAPSMGVTRRAPMVRSVRMSGSSDDPLAGFDGL